MDELFRRFPFYEFLVAGIVGDPFAENPAAEKRTKRINDLLPIKTLFCDVGRKTRPVPKGRFWRFL